MNEWLDIAMRETGVKEYAGDADNPDIVKYLKTVDLPEDMQIEDETPWCSAFVNWCVEQAGFKGTGMANARSWLDWGESLDEPVNGCIVVLWRDHPKSWKGHVGFYVDPHDGEFVRMLGGNQSDRVCYQLYPRSRVLSYRLPAAPKDPDNWRRWFWENDDPLSIKTAQEAIHEWARGKGWWPFDTDSIASELADATIRIMDIAEAHSIDLEEAVKAKMLYNESREHRHGGKAC